MNTAVTNKATRQCCMYSILISVTIENRSCWQLEYIYWSLSVYRFLPNRCPYWNTFKSTLTLNSIVDGVTLIPGMGKLESHLPDSDHLSLQNYIIPVFHKIFQLQQSNFNLTLILLKLQVKFCKYELQDNYFVWTVIANGHETKSLYHILQVLIINTLYFSDHLHLTLQFCTIQFASFLVGTWCTCVSSICTPHTYTHYYSQCKKYITQHIHNIEKGNFKSEQAQYINLTRENVRTRITCKNVKSITLPPTTTVLPVWKLFNNRRLHWVNVNNVKIFNMLVVRIYC